MSKLERDIHADKTSTVELHLGGNIIKSVTTATTANPSLSKDVHEFHTAGGTATLGAGTTIGQTITLAIVSGTGVVVVTSAHLAVHNTITFSDVGESVTFYWASTNKWVLLSNNGALITTV